jgi:hypothetical protein
MVGVAGTQMTNFEYPVEEWFTGQYADIPIHMQETIKRYVIEKVRPGDFLSAIITNDLRGAVNYADADNLARIKLYVQWFYNRAPAICSGSKEAMTNWLSGNA